MMDFSRDNMCLVGNGGSALSSLNGNTIDSYETVIRINSFDTSSKYSPYIGSKTDIWVTSLYLNVKDRGDLVDRIFIPFPRFGRYSFREELLSKYSDKIVFIPEEYFEEMIDLVPLPSTGFSFLFWMYKEFGTLNNDSIFGFSFFSKDENHHYYDGYDECSHNGELEERIYRSMIIKDKESS